MFSETKSATAGVFRVPRSSGEPEQLFEYDFVQLSNDVIVSQGKWGGVDGGSYTFVIPSPTAYVLTVTQLTEQQVQHIGFVFVPFV